MIHDQWYQTKKEKSDQWFGMIQKQKESFSDFHLSNMYYFLLVLSTRTNITTKLSLWRKEVPKFKNDCSNFFLVKGTVLFLPISTLFGMI